MAYRDCKETVENIVQKIKSELPQMGFTLLAEINHTENTRKTDRYPLPAIVLFLGSHETEIELMLEAPAIAWEFPLKLLILEQKEGSSRLIWAEPDALELRYGIFENRHLIYQLSDSLKKLAKTVCVTA